MPKVMVDTSLHLAVPSLKICKSTSGRRPLGMANSAGLESVLRYRCETA